MSTTRKRRVPREIILAAKYRVPKSVTTDTVLSFFESLDCPRSLMLSILFKNQEWQQIADLDINPANYRDGYSFRDAYTATMFLAKADFLELEVSKAESAMVKFCLFEELCKCTNKRFRNLELDPLFNGSNVWLLNAVIRKISDILGDISAQELFADGNWGPGVTTLVKGDHVSDVNKFHAERGITRQLYSLLSDVFPVAYPAWYQWIHDSKPSNQESPFVMQVGNTIVTVPKNSKTDRVIAIEPGLNLWFQKAIGKAIRRRLKRCGIDLNHQTRNQKLSRLGAVFSHLATVDFSSASDSIAMELVRALLPPRWFELLSACRSPVGMSGKTLVRWEKFSSMGNGFTFELESLIFYAAALVVAEHLGEETPDISVYGDDVIIPVQCYQLFASFSEFLGFQVNLSKSFSTGYFRESCGDHWWGAIDCKPVYLKERLSNVSSVYKLANRIRDLAHRRCFTDGCDDKFRNVWSRLVARIPKPLRFGVPATVGDCGLSCNFDEAVPEVAKHGIEGFYVRGLLEVPVKGYGDSPAVLLARLRAMSIDIHELMDTNRPKLESYSWNELVRFYGLKRLAKYHADVLKGSTLSTIAKGNEYALRGVTEMKLSKILVPQWYNLGPWLTL